MSNEQEIINKAKSGDSASFFFLMNKYEKGLNVYVSKLLNEIGTINNFAEQAEEPKDICQEAFHKAFQNIKNYDPKYEFSTWLFSIARNLVIDYTRKRKLPINSSDNNGCFWNRA